MVSVVKTCRVKLLWKLMGQQDDLGVGKFASAEHGSRLPHPMCACGADFGVPAVQMGSHVGRMWLSKSRLVATQHSNMAHPMMVGQYVAPLCPEVPHGVGYLVVPSNMAGVGRGVV